jgi:preprotein translocase subunit SecD
MTTKKPIDLSYIFETEDDEPVQTTPVDILGESFDVRQDINAFQLARLGDPEHVAQAMTRILLDSVGPDDQDRLVKLLGSIPHLTAKKLAELFNAVLEAAAGGTPTQSSPVSKRTTPKKAVARRSVVRSSAKG